MMTKKVFDQIAAGLREAIAIARGEKKPARLHMVRRSTSSNKVTGRRPD
jgi:hypothetical protein